MWLAAGPSTAEAQTPSADIQLSPPESPETSAQERDEPPISPLGAFARSLVVPGWGQAEVDQPVRGAFYFAAEAASVFMVFKSQAKLRAARKGEADDPGLVESRTGQREDWIVLSVFLAFFSGLDAWVSTQLYDFEPELTPPEDGRAGVEFTIRVPLNFP